MIYNYRIKKIYVSTSIWFDKSFSYYDTDHKITDKDDDDTELGDIWNETNNKKFGKVIVREQIVERDVTLAYSTF